MSDYTNVFTNVITPFDPRRTKLLLGSLEYIAAEVIVAKVARKIIRADNKGWFELAYIHALSLRLWGVLRHSLSESPHTLVLIVQGNQSGLVRMLWMVLKEYQQC